MDTSSRLCPATRLTDSVGNVFSAPSKVTGALWRREQDVTAGANPRKAPGPVLGPVEGLSVDLTGGRAPVVVVRGKHDLVVVRTLTATYALEPRYEAIAPVRRPEPLEPRPPLGGAQNR